MVPEDVPALVDLWVAAWRRAWSTQASPIDFDARRDWLAAFLRAPRHRTLVACVEGRPVGFATFEGAYLHQLAVDPSAQGRGLATALLAAVEAATDIPLELDVNADNPLARDFYQRRGFVVVGSGRNPTSGLETLRLRQDPRRP